MSARSNALAAMGRSERVSPGQERRERLAMLLQMGAGLAPAAGTALGGALWGVEGAGVGLSAGQATSAGLSNASQAMTYRDEREDDAKNRRRMALMQMMGYR